MYESDPDKFKTSTDYAKGLFTKGILFGIMIVSLSWLLWFTIPILAMNFILAMGFTFGTIYAFQQYLGLRIVQGIVKKGYVTPSDLRKLQSLKLGFRR